jgi:hypothetical protein
MTTHQTPKKTSPDLIRTIALLTDVQEALEKKAFIEEARLVSLHLEQLSSPQTESRIAAWGIEPILEEMAQEFIVGATV